MQNTTTVVLLRFLTDDTDDSTRQGRSRTWQDMLALISREPGWKFTNVGKGFCDGIVVCLIIGEMATSQRKITSLITVGWQKDGPSDTFRSEKDPERCTLFKPIESTLAESPHILHVGFHPDIHTAWGAVTKISPEAKDSTLMELMLVRVPFELHADCTRLSDNIVDHFWETLENRPSDVLTRVAWCGCKQGCGSLSGPIGDAKDARYHVLLWQWTTPEERDRFRDPAVGNSNPENLVYHGDWYHQTVSKPLAALVSKGATIVTYDLQVTVALGRNGWPMEARKPR